MSLQPRWDIFCPVVDNFGDVGVCWRLARQLAREEGIAPRLWVDDLASARRLIPSLPSNALCHLVEGVEIRSWQTCFPLVEPGPVVIAAFAATLPEGFLEAMAGCVPPPRWINLEYLSAEDWVAGCHRLPSPHPRLPLVQHFFFPGFDRFTGGLLREGDYAWRRSAFQESVFLKAGGIPSRQPGELFISLFCYENPALQGLLSAWGQGPGRVTCLVPEGRALPDICDFFGISALKAGDRLTKDHLVVHVLPFVEQTRYDELLWACDLNFVRGEDSFVRAQWAEKPFVWHIYRQEDEAHLKKLAAFLSRFCAGLDPEVRSVLQTFWVAWNQGDGQAVVASWPAFRKALAALAAHGEAWSARLQLMESLSAQLVRFCKDGIE
ncbi:elongation factor P maturation arginine rhamnosyltransferase EarP [Zoogloea sp.]|uniref:elongation factor P maturation arginine rhamnosyltransferase EarP n=1 Tax=Zoogloea sp. TaxID=49181 RepID=UPI0026121E46|nr:elongation factor P maturation arginine rhamnosyltransferase EarP [Zoogloea sp.]MDD3352957.1 elongation factor P maturation arginine rhamnosyltransferase EarP [Zoogloea sp.]